MGRGGGSHGGGGHSGGRSFGGRSGGGYSGGPLTGGAGFGGHYHRWGRPFYPAGGFGWGGPGRRGGCLTPFIIIIFLAFFISFFSGTSQSTNEVTVSRTDRTAVTDTVTYSKWYIDELNFINHDTDLTDGLKYYYSKTGIQPFVMLLDYNPDLWPEGKWNEDAAEQYLAEIYSDTFSDNGHLIFAYFACENDSEDMDGVFYFYYGSAAYSIMDNEAETIFWSYFDMNYNDLDQSISEFIGQTFRQTADNIMHIESGSQFSIINIAVIFGGICIFVIIIGIVVYKKSSRSDTDLN